MDRGKAAAALLAILVGGSLLLALLASLPSAGPPSVDTPWVGPWLWEVRGLDLTVQALLILAGVLGVLLMLGPEGEEA